MSFSLPQKRRVRIISTGLVTVLFSGLLLALAQDRKADLGADGSVSNALGIGELPPGHSDCEFFGPRRQELVKSGLYALKRRYLTSARTQDVVSKLPRIEYSERAMAPPGSRTDVFQQLEELGTIDRHLFQAMKAAGVVPARKTNDFEFARRVTLDLTGRAPTVDRLLEFAADPSPDKRERLADELLNSSEWVDRWTMYYGDLFKNAQRTSQVNRYADGRNAFYKWIKVSLATNKSYDRIATELIASSGSNSFEQGELNWIVGGQVTGGPRTGQDNFDQQAANVAETFLGISNMNCILCHDGRRHLDTLSLWGANATRYEAWQLASFLSRTVIKRTKVGTTNKRYSSVEDARSQAPYPLNTLTGNRPARQPIGSIANVTPEYPFSGGRPASGEGYREALAREVTADVQFARAAVNYLWKEFFGIGLVDPVNQFDPARLDPDNPPPEPWTLQPSQPRLLNALAQDFIDSGFDLKALMRQFVNSRIYQLSSRYEGAWNPKWESLFARKYVRRLWAEEIHDAIAQTSNFGATYNVSGLDSVNWAMQLPEPGNLPGARYTATTFLNSFIRGDRDEEERRWDGSAVQALNLMNHIFVTSRCVAAGSGATNTLTQKALGMNDEEAVNTLFLTVLSRYPTAREMAVSLDNLRSGDRKSKMEDLQWALYNKVDFIFNY